MVDLKRLAFPFEADELEWRVQSSGGTAQKPWAHVLCYVTNRAIMNRLDEVCGADGWQNQFKQIDQYKGDQKSEAGFLCGISILCSPRQNDTEEWVTKWDGADSTQIESIKGGISDSMKRAAVQWGIGRYLYEIESAFATTRNVTKETPGARYCKKGDVEFYWLPPILPDWALPERKTPAAKKAQTTQAETVTDEDTELNQKRLKLYQEFKETSIPEVLYDLTPNVVKNGDKIHIGETFKAMGAKELNQVRDFLYLGKRPERPE